MKTCSNCKNTFTDNYCGQCGQPAKLKRIDAHFILHEITHVLHLEKGIFFTVKELFVRPGATVRTFIREDRNRLVKPILFLILTSIIYSIFSYGLHTERTEQALHQINILPVTQFFMDWIFHHFGYANLIVGVFIAFWLKLFFRKQDYNFFEILILLCFLMGNSMLIISVVSLIERVSHLNLIDLSTIPVWIYCAWGIGQFFNQKNIGSYFKALSAYILGTGTFYFIFLFITLVIDIIILKSHNS